MGEKGRCERNRILEVNPYLVQEIQALLKVLGDLYASQLVRSSSSARVSFHHPDMLWSHLGYFI